MELTLESNRTNCLLCKSINLETIAVVDPKLIVKKYKKYYGANFNYLFKTKKIDFLKCNNCDLRFYNPLVPGDEHFYSVLQTTNHYYRENKEEYSLAAQIINEGSSILDVGCGKGEFKKFVPGCDFTGLEFSKDAIKAGIKNGVNILNEPIQEHAVLNKGKYDFVTSFQVLEHVADIATFVKSCADCVKPGGSLIIAVPSEESYLHLLVNSILNMPPHHISRWTDKALQYIASLINFEFVQLHHDKMDPLHLDSYFTSLVERSLPFRISTDTKLFDDSIYYKIRYFIARILATNIIKKSNHPAWIGKGQNVTVVFKKPINK